VPATASAMLAADPVVSGVYYVDDHFVPYAGAKPVGKGWNNKRSRAEKGCAGTRVTAHDGAGGVLRDREAAASPRNGADSNGAAHARQAR